MVDRDVHQVYIHQKKVHKYCSKVLLYALIQKFSRFFGFEKNAFFYRLDFFNDSGFPISDIFECCYIYIALDVTSQEKSYGIVSVDRETYKIGLL